MVATKETKPNIRPWGSIAALLAACFATLVGLARDIDPEIILWRAVVAATLVGAVAAIAGSVAQSLQIRGARK